MQHRFLALAMAPVLFLSFQAAAQESRWRELMMNFVQLYSQGRYAEAQTAANNAKKWAIISAIVGAVVAVIAVILYVGLFAIAVSNLPSTTTTTYSGY